MLACETKTKILFLYTLVRSSRTNGFERLLDVAAASTRTEKIPNGSVVGREGCPLCCSPGANEKRFWADFVAPDFAEGDASESRDTAVADSSRFLAVFLFMMEDDGEEGPC
jgi:hypothetical protein